MQRGLTTCRHPARTALPDAPAALGSRPPQSAAGRWAAAAVAAVEGTGGLYYKFTLMTGLLATPCRASRVQDAIRRWPQRISKQAAVPSSRDQASCTCTVHSTHSSHLVRRLVARPHKRVWRLVRRQSRRLVGDRCLQAEVGKQR